jgi:hypothetical protein
MSTDDEEHRESELKGTLNQYTRHEKNIPDKELNT